MELHYVFIKNNRVEEIAVFAEQNEDLVNKIIQEKEFDSAIWVGETTPEKYSLWDGENFISPTPEWLFENGYIAALPDTE